MEGVRELLRKTVETIGRGRDVYERLGRTERFVEIQIPVRLDDGSTTLFTGYRSQHNSLRGPYKGGIRFHPGVNADKMKALSAWMTIKSALLNLPFGGGKGGVICSPGALSTAELERLSRGYMRALSGLLGPELDVPGPDVGTNPQVMAWMADEYRRVTGTDQPAVVTGKPVSHGGMAGRTEATARGCAVAIAEAARVFDLTLAGASVAIQGFGNVGSNLAQFLGEMGLRVVAVSDVYGGVYNPNGLQLPALMDHFSRHGTVEGFPDGEPMGSADSLFVPVDILVPAALGNQITINNVHRVSAGIVVEAANGPTSPDADAVLRQRGVPVVPDILANAGGVTVSYFEWRQNRHGSTLTESDANRQLRQLMIDAFRSTYQAHIKYGVALREAAYSVAIERLALAMVEEDGGKTGASSIGGEAKANTRTHHTPIPGV